MIFSTDVYSVLLLFSASRSFQFSDKLSYRYSLFVKNKQQQQQQKLSMELGFPNRALSLGARHKLVPDREAASAALGGGLGPYALHGTHGQFLAFWLKLVIFASSLTHSGFLVRKA